jgi:hypothetical protein
MNIALWGLSALLSIPLAVFLMLISCVLHEAGHTIAIATLDRSAIAAVNLMSVTLHFTDKLLVPWKMRIVGSAGPIVTFALGAIGAWLLSQTSADSFLEKTTMITTLLVTAFNFYTGVHNLIPKIRFGGMTDGTWIFHPEKSCRIVRRVFKDPATRDRKIFSRHKFGPIELTLSRDD